MKVTNVTVPVEKTYTLELSETEAEILASVLGSYSSNCKTYQLFKSLHKAGIDYYKYDTQNENRESVPALYLVER